MATDKYNILRKVLRALGLIEERTEEIVALIQGWFEDDDYAAGKSKKGWPEVLPYLLRDDFLSNAETSFYHVAKGAAAEWAVVLTKVSLGDLFYAQSGDYKQNRIWRNRIDRKHVDFLLCEPGTMRPLLGVELDDKSHDRPERRQRDRFVDRVFGAAGLPLLHVPVRYSYHTDEIGQLLRDKAAIAPVPVAVVEESPANPECPNCGAAMVLRTAKKGKAAGNQFWGCPNYPRCRGVVAIGS